MNYHKVLFIGYGPHGRIFCEVELRPHRSGITELSITGVEGPLSNGNCRGSCGQIRSEIMEAAVQNRIRYAEGWSFLKVDEFLQVWERWHLNCLQAGSPRQRAYLESKGLNNVGYETACDALKEAGLLIDEEYLHNGHPYKYGHAWLQEELPEEVLAFVKALPETTVKPAWV